jgi:hypothetical protein
VSNNPKQCWKCGRLIDFRTRLDGRKKWVWARDVINGKHHKCPKIFVEAMTDFHKPVRCACGDQIYEVPIFGGLIMPFDRVQWPWRTHDCSSPNGVLPGIWNSPPEELGKKCSELKLPEPYLLVVIVCEKRLAGPEPKYLVALKSVCGGRFCTFFVGQGKFRLGELSVLCGDGLQQSLLTNSDQIFDSDGPGRPEWTQELSHRWLEDAA